MFTLQLWKLKVSKGTGFAARSSVICLVGSARQVFPLGSLFSFTVHVGSMFSVTSTSKQGIWPFWRSGLAKKEVRYDLLLHFSSALVSSHPCH